MNFGEKLKQVRCDKNMTQPQLAEAIGIEQSYLSKLENDKSVPSADMFQSIIKTLEMSAKEFLQDIDKNILHGPLRQIPEVANLIAETNNQTIHSIRKWLYGSSLACVLGLTMITAGYLGLVFPKTQITYRSEGVILPNEPINIFDKNRHSDLIVQKNYANEITYEMASKMRSDFQSNRVRPQILTSFYEQGQSFDQPVKGGIRHYERAGSVLVDRFENNVMMLLGIFLVFSGLFGFFLELRLRKSRM